MSYIEKNLMNGESIVTRAQLHAVVYVWPVVLAIASFVVMGFAAFTESYAYPVGVGVVMLVIVVTHFIPKRAYAWLECRFVAAPWIVKLVVFLAVVQLVLQFASAEVQPFIYNQF